MSKTSSPKYFLQEDSDDVKAGLATRVINMLNIVKKLEPPEEPKPEEPPKELLPEGKT